LRGAVRIRFRRLRHGQDRRGDARRAARPTGERSYDRTTNRGGGAGEDHPAPAGDTGGIMSGITTHVLDTMRGRPAAGVAVSLARKSGNGWTELAAASTDAGGRVGNLLPAQVKDPAGTYRLRFDV